MATSNLVDHIYLSFVSDLIMGKEWHNQTESASLCFYVFGLMALLEAMLDISIPIPPEGAVYL